MADKIVIVNPFTGEFIECSKRSKAKWVPVALEWLDQCSQYQTFNRELRRALATLTDNRKLKTAHFSEPCGRFKVTLADRSFNSAELIMPFEKQAGLELDLRPVKQRVSYDVSLSALKKLEKTRGKLVDEVKKLVRAAEKPPGTPRVTIVRKAVEP